jgi:hypothetical protein
VYNIPKLETSDFKAFSTLVPNSSIWRAAVCCDKLILENCSFGQQQVQNFLEQIHLPKKLWIFGVYSNYYTARLTNESDWQILKKRLLSQKLTSCSHNLPSRNLTLYRPVLLSGNIHV